MSKQIKLRCCLFFMDLNQSITEAVFFHWLNYRKHKEGNLPNLQPQRATYHHRSKQKDHQLPRRHFQPKQQHLPTLHKAQHHTTVRTLREQSSTDHHKEHTCRHQQTTFIPFIRQSFIRRSRSPVPEST